MSVKLSFYWGLCVQDLKGSRLSLPMIVSAVHTDVLGEVTKGICHQTGESGHMLHFISL
jgi:hypothetical protein